MNRYDLATGKTPPKKEETVHKKVASKPKKKSTPSDRIADALVTPFVPEDLISDLLFGQSDPVEPGEVDSEVPDEFTYPLLPNPPVGSFRIGCPAGHQMVIPIRNLNVFIRKYGGTQN